MKLAVMQPYFVPYIGYWQLLNTADQFVVYDDVNYIKRGWINRNRILEEGKPLYFNIPIRKASQNKRINQIEVNHDEKLKAKNLRTIELAYKKAPYFGQIYPIVEEIIRSEEELLSEYILHSLKVICKYLGIETQLRRSSDIPKDNGLKGQDKILEICAILGAEEYYNAIGGRNLYSFEAFSARNIRLGFIKTDDIRYRQFGNEFCENLSILDIMMFNSVPEIREMLEQYTVITEGKGDQ